MTSAGDFHLHFVSCGIAHDYDFCQAEEALEGEIGEIITFEGKKYLLKPEDGKKYEITWLKQYLPDLGKREMTGAELKEQLEKNLSAEEITLTPITDLDKFAKKIASDVFVPMQAAWKESVNWLNQQFDSMVSSLNPRPEIPPSLPEIGILQAIKDSQYAKNHYAIQGNSLYLTDGKVCTHKVNLLEGIFKGNEYFLNRCDFLNLIDPGNASQHSSVSLHEAVEILIEKGKNVQKEKFSGNFFYKRYIEAYGISEEVFKEVLFGQKSTPYLLSLCGDVLGVEDLCKGSSRNIQRRLLTEVLQKEEEKILNEIPKEDLKDPDLTRSHLIAALSEKGLTYEEAVIQFDRRFGIPEKEIVEGSYVLAKLIAQIDAWKSLQSKSKEASKGDSFREVWRFFIDGDEEKNGAYYFENEPFYMLSCLRGFKNILDSQESMSMDTYELYAEALTRNPPVLKSWDALRQKVFTLDNPSFFFNTKPKKGIQGFDPRKMDKKNAEGIGDLEERTFFRIEAEKLMQEEGSDTVSNRTYWMANAMGFSYNTLFLRAHVNTSNEIIFQRIFLGREQMLQNAVTPGERLIAHIWAARELEITHPFGDANGRTSITSLIKWIADDPELSMYMPENPNILDLQSPEAIIRDVHSGMKRFQDLYGEGSKKLVDVETLVDEAGVRGASWDVVHKRAELPEEVIAQLVSEDKTRALS